MVRHRPLTGCATRAPGRADFPLNDRAIPKEVSMRIPALTMLTISAALTATPAAAQTYDPKYPVCLQVYQGFVDYYFECAYTSLAQCQMSASGRAASCVVNPYYGGGKARRDRRQRRDY
jgi:hypothetical protein